eukprot:19161-Heterococcus_DN1.PRE.3
MYVTGGSTSCLVLQRTVRAYLSRMASLCKGPRVGRHILYRYRTYGCTCGDRHRYDCRELLAQSSHTVRADGMASSSVGHLFTSGTCEGLGGQTTSTQHTSSRELA